MALKLRVISDQYQNLGKRSSRLFGVSGGRIGRSADNDWVLPDPDRYISSHHAKISFRAGAWILEDTSTNGVFVNGSGTPLSEAGLHKMLDGDRLRLGDYELLVSIDERNDFPPDASGQMLAPSQPLASSPFGEDLGEDLDISALLMGGSDPTPRSLAEEPIELSNAYGVEVPLIPPPLPRNASRRPARWWATSPTRGHNARSPARARRIGIWPPDPLTASRSRRCKAHRVEAPMVRHAMPTARVSLMPVSKPSAAVSASIQPRSRERRTQRC